MKKFEKGKITDILALTPMQEGMLFHYLKEPGSDYYFEQLSLEVSGSLDIHCFERAWHIVIETNEMLRTVFRWEKLENPVQVVLKESPFKLKFHDFVNESEGIKSGRLEEIKIKDRRKAFDLREVPFRVTLCRIEENRYGIIISNHHILYDGWSTGIILKEFLAAYTDLVNKRIPAKPVKPAFKEFVRRARDEGGVKKGETFWKNLLEGFDAPLEFSIKKRPAKEKKSRETGNYPVTIDKDIKDRLERYVKESKITSAALLYSAWGILLQKYNHTDDAVFGTTVSGRNIQFKGIEDMVGLFINTVPLRVKVIPGEKVKDFLLRINLQMKAREEYEHSPLVDIKGYSDIGANEEMFDTVLVIENYPLDQRLKQENNALSFDSHSIFERSHYDLTLGITLGDRAAVRFYYREELFNDAVIRRLSQHYSALIEKLIDNPGQEITDIDMLSLEEKRQILKDFNAADADYGRDKTIQQLFEQQVTKTPDNIALISMEHGARSMALTYRELNETSNQLAYSVMEKGLVPGAIAAVMVERSVEMIIGILAVLKAGGAYLPLNPHSPGERKHYMLEDCSAAILLTTGELFEEGETIRRWEGETIFLDILETRAQSSPAPCALRPASLAYIIYTSGSTGKPKGVPVTHFNLSPLLHWGYHRLGLSTGDRTLQNLAYYFDWSVWEIFITLTSGAGLFVVPDEVLLNPGVCIAFINKHDITVLHVTPTQYGYFAGTNQKTGTLKYLFIGAEKLNHELVKRSFELVARDCRVFNMYGPTEAAVISSVLEIDRTRLQEFEDLSSIPIGGAVANAGLLVLDNYLKLCPVNTAGELYISGDGVSHGYLNNPELTAERFKFNRSYRSYRTYLSYRTGDLARWLPDGSIEFLGRIDFQVKIRGFRIELGEIEHQLLNHPGIKEALVIARDDGSGDRYLCAYIIPDVSHASAAVDMAQLKEYLLAKLPDYMVPTHFFVLEKMPLNANGKIDRKSLPEPKIVSTEKYAAPRNALEKRLVEIWSDVLGIREEKVGIDDNFFELGGHSLKATALVTRIHKHFDIEVPLSQLFHAPTVRKLFSYIQKTNRQKQLVIESSEEREYYELTAAQKRFYVFQQMEPDSVSYNMPKIMRMKGPVSREKFEEVFKKLIRRYDVLRTSFQLVEGEPVQRVWAEDAVAFEVEYYETEIEEQQLEDNRVPVEVRVIEKNFNRPFDLDLPPLLRVDLIRARPELYFLLFDMHHIVSDGVSVGIFIKEFLALYNGEKLPALPIRYRDYVNWLKNKSHKEAAAAGDAAGQGRTAPGEVLNLPTDYVRPTASTFEGDTIIFELSEQQKKELLSLSVELKDTTVYMVLLSVFYTLLSKLSGQESIVVGSPMAGRLHQDLEGLIGLFINTLVLRNFLSGEKAFSEFLAEVKENTLHAFDNQEYQYEELIDAITTASETGRNPLFDVMFVYQNMEIPEIEIPGIDTLLYPEQGWSSKFDMTLYCEEHNDYLFKWEYSTRLFKPGTIWRFIRCFKKVIAEILVNPHKKISEIEILPKEEKKQILYDFNDTVVEYPREKTVFQWFQEQAGQTPERSAVIGTGFIASTSYRQLNEKSNQLARWLRRRGLKANRVVGIMMERSTWALAAIYSVLKAGGAYLPIDPEYPGNRITGMLEKSGAALLLTTREIAAKKSLHSLSQKQEILVLDEAEQSGELERESPGNLEPVSGPGDLIYIIFTSGSTGTPKGAGVYHRGFMNLVHWFVSEFQLDENDRNLWLTSLSFDLTQKNLYAPLVTGATLCIPRFNYFEPRSLLREIHEHRVTWINCTPSMFYKMVEYESAGEEKRLTRLRYVFLGGEPISMPTLIDWLESEHCRAELVNTYGPTECTDISNYYRVKNPRQFLEQNIPVGYPVYNVQLFVPDRYLRPVPVGVPGELLIGGVSVGIGYINDRELTAQKFIRHSFAGEPERLLYRTGDLVRWLPEGAIEFLGRIDHQVKVRGFRIELGEIENQLLSYPHVKETVVLAREGDGGDKYLCAYIVPHEPDTLDIPGLREHLAAELPDYMVPPYFVILEKMPLNPNGKVDRKALPEPDRTADRDYVPPRDEKEKVLVNIWSEVLGVDGDRVGIHDNFFRLGGHSLKAASLVGRIHKAFSVEIPVAQLFKIPTIKGISGYIEKTGESIYLSLKPVEEKEYYTLSSAQKRLFFIHQMDPGNITYNLPGIIKLEGSLDGERFEKAFRQLSHRHESLRTSFRVVGREPVQKIHRQVEFEIEYYSAERTAQSAERKIKHFIRPFDLSKAPLLRVGLIKAGKQEHILMFDMHHIVSDGVSMGVFIEEFTSLYSNRTLPQPQLQYKGFSHWQNRLLASEKIKEQETFWQRQFEDEIPVLSLPADYPRPSVQQFAGDRIDFEIGPEETGAVKQLALENGATLYMVLFALFNLFLSKLSGQEDIVVGTAVAGRRRQDLENIIGMFVNLLALRTYAPGRKRFTEFLSKLKENILAAFENQDYQYEELVEKVVTDRDLSRNPLFDTVFVLQNMDISEIQIPGLVLTPYSYETKTSKFDMTLIGVETRDGMSFQLEYSSKLFKETTIRRFIDYFRGIISGILKNPGIKLAETAIISEEEKRRVLVDFNNTQADYPGDKTIHRLFEEQVEKAPGRIAVIGTAQGAGSGVSLTYRELAKISGRLAAHLIEKGVKSADIVGIIGGRSPGMVVGILAVLKTGGIYLPIDADYPAERQRFMLTDSSARVLMSEGNKPGESSGGIEAMDLTTVMADEYDEYKKEFPAQHTHSIQPLSTDSAYIMYTSGSTGQPKGVIVTHRSVVRLVKNTNFVPLREGTRILQTGAPVFDAATFEIWGSLLNGGQLVLTDKETILDAHRLAGVLKEYRVNTLWLSSPLFNQLMQQDIELFSPLCYLLVGGDILSPAHISRVKQRFPRLSIINGYGPTENTTFSTTYLIEEETDHNIPIGTPINNSTAYIVDKNGHLQPIGVWGELYVGGDGLSLGYLNNPELTAEKFNRSYRSYRSYKTGDRARWLPDGNIEFAGRIDQQVKIRGYRVEPGEIEDRLSKHDDVREAVVIPLPDEKGNKYLCAYIVSNRDVPVTGLRDYLSNQLPDYMIPSHFTFLEKIPLTPNGKIDRKALPAPGAKAAGVYTAPRNYMEERLVDLWSSILGVEKKIIGIDSDFFELGGDSLKAAVLVSKIHKEFNVKIPLTRLFQTPVTRRLAEYIGQAAVEAFIAIEGEEKKDYYPLSSAQKRLYILQQMDLESTRYNIPAVMMLEGRLEEGKLKDTFMQLIDRHESLRTSFEMINSEPVQRVRHLVDFEFRYYEAERPASTIKSFIRPFDLSQAPLLRVGLIKQDHTKHILVVDMHHIISDGVSMEIFVKEFMIFIAGENPPPLRLQYKDYSRWQNSPRHAAVIKAQENYWLKEMAGETPVLELPYDYPRPPVKKSAGSRLRFDIGEEGTTQLSQLALETGATPFMVFLAVFNLLLSKLSGKQDIIVGTPVAGRPHNDLQNIIGVFINTLALRNYPAAEKRFSEFLTQVKENCIRAFENRDYPYEDLVEAVVTDRDLSRNSLFDVMLVLQNMTGHQPEIPGLKLIPCDYESVTSKFDITLTVVEGFNRFEFSITYSTALFEKSTIQRFINYFKRILTAVLKDSGRGIAEIDILSGDEKSRLLYDFNAAVKDYPKDRTIHRLFEEQAEKTPHNIALVGRSLQPVPVQSTGYISYKKLAEKSDQLARLLIAKGVSPGAVIGIMVEASLEMVIAILAILKAGGAYLPVDPGYPQQRMHFMLKDSSAGILLSGVSEVSEVTGWEGEIVYPGDWLSEVSKVSGNFPIHLTHPAQLCYVIYTSGSSGRPRGVLVRHRNVMNLLVGLKERIYNGCTGYLRVALAAPVGFDASVKQIFGALLQGHGLYIIPGTARLDGSRLWLFFRQHKIDITDGTPAHLYILSEVPVDKNSLETGCYPGHFVVGGDAVSPGLVERFLNCFAKTKRPKITNIYGPTECTVDSTSFAVPADNLERFTHIPIGKPLPNHLVYILGPGGGLQPIGVPGELFIGGQSVARGYLNRPELTAEKFVVSHLSLVNDNSTNDRCPMTNDKLYRTGDRVRWLPDGNIEFLGRIDRQVKIRGYRIEPGEIESRLLLYNGIKDAVVITKQDNTAQNYLCAYITAGGDFSRPELMDHLTAVLPHYMIPSYVVQLEKFPLTPNGKLNRKLLPEPETGAAAARYAAPRSRVEKRLAHLWQELLGVEQIGINDNFFQRGGHSLKAIMLVNRIRKALNAGIDLTDVFRYPTISALAAHIKGGGYVRDEPAPIPPVEEKEYYPLSSTQKRLYLLYQSNRRSTGYNIPEMLMLEGKLEKEKLEKTFKQLVRRHESFRTSFEQVKGEPVQRIHKENDKFQVANYKDPGGGLQDIIKNFVRPFDLSRAPLLRVGLIKIAEEQHVLAVDMHHIISDGASISLLVLEFMKVYAGKPLPRSPLHYKDYVRWQCSAARQESLEAAETYWLGRFTGSPLPRLKLPIDFPRPPVQRFEGAADAFQLPPGQTAALKQVAHEGDATLYMVLLALFNILLARLSGQEDIIVGTPVLGRSREELHHIIGMFVNTLALRNFPGAQRTFADFLNEVKEHTLSAFKYQDYPLEKLVEKAGVERDINRNPLFDVMFVLQNPDTPEFRIPGLTLKPYPYEGATSKFDLNLIATEKDDTLSFTLEYSTKLFRAETIERFIRYFKDIITAVLEDKGIRLGDIKIALELSEAESTLALEAEGDFGF